MRLFSYVVARDYGFAPNPFFGVCTLATCKPNIRRTASVGDWVIGTGGASRGKCGFLVYAMHVTQTLTFNEYWNSAPLRLKRPNLRGSKKQAFGDNIYYWNTQWHQADSHHSRADGALNPYNVQNDTQTDRVLASTEFAYFGGSGPEVPPQFRDWHGRDICARRNHKCRFTEDLIDAFVTWYHTLGEKGYVAAPLDWARTP